MFDKKDHKEQFAKLTCEESIGLLRHDVGHHLYNSIGFCEFLLENYNDLAQDDAKLKEMIQIVLKHSKKAYEIIVAFTDPYLKNEQE
jgi:hypothetical protein